tara:strand:- start:1653 stop:2303 length:651 start_codon:yes stop_codon:yes gene_type:complete
MKRVLITGANRGLGRCLKKQFSQKGCTVFGHSRKGDQQLTGDITNDEFPDTLEHFLIDNQIDIFINNAAIYEFKNFIDYDASDIKKIIDTNLTSQILMLQRVYKYFYSRNEGFIANINSLAGRHPSPTELIYGATKHGLRAFSESLQIASRNTNIKIVDFYPGAMKTVMTLGRDGFDSFMNPGEVAQVVCDTLLNQKDTLLTTEVVIRKFNQRKTP